MRKIAARCLFILSLSSPAFGAGFGFYEQTAAATGLGGAFVARGNSISGLFYNPACAGKIETDELSLGGTLVIPSTSYTAPAGDSLTDGERNVFFPPNAYYGRRIDDRIAFGIGFFVPYGLSTEWPSDWSGRYLSIKADIRSYYVNPVLAYRLNEKVVVAAGLNYVRSSLGFQRKIDLSPLSPAFGGIDLPDADLVFDASGDGLGFNGGVLIDASPDITVGASYRSQVDVKYSGAIDFSVPATGYGQVVDTALNVLFPDGDASTAMELPQQLNFGVDYHGVEGWVFDFAFWWTGWSSIDRIALNLENHSTAPTQAIQGNPIERDYDNSYSIRFGAEHTLNEQWRVRAGYLWDRSPVPEKTVDPLLPDANRHSIQLGAGFTFPDDRYSADFAYMAVFFSDRSTNTNLDRFNGTYATTAHLLALSFSYRFE